MDDFQTLLMLNMQVVTMIASSVTTSISVSYVCPLYTYLSFYLTFAQSMFLIKVNTSLGISQAWWFNSVWCFILYSYVASILFGVLEFVTQFDMTRIVEYMIKNRLLLNALKVFYFGLFTVTAVVILSICDPRKCG
jgi:hypothetical protein